MHDGAHQIVIGIEGMCEVEVEGNTVPLGPGQLVRVAPGQRHVVRAAGAEQAVVYVSVTPHREPTHIFFDAVGDRPLPPTEPGATDDR